MNEPICISGGPERKSFITADGARMTQQQTIALLQSVGIQASHPCTRNTRIIVFPDSASGPSDTQLSKAARDAVALPWSEFVNSLPEGEAKDALLSGQVRQRERKEKPPGRSRPPTFQPRQRKMPSFQNVLGTYLRQLNASSISQALDRAEQEGLFEHAQAAWAKIADVLQAQRADDIEVAQSLLALYSLVKQSPRFT